MIMATKVSEEVHVELIKGNAVLLVLGKRWESKEAWPGLPRQ